MARTKVKEATDIYGVEVSGDAAQRAAPVLISGELRSQQIRAAAPILGVWQKAGK
ncbi:hypothetical protein LTR69_011288 [Exophiala sideris]|uniref:Uncharacterized protein n=1 Tax=Exophiala sideris TaxID=1016849 RepID=A0ABR0IUP5_9EURO|nr:hypothetical protein LTR69_011288 [Exophiala sideris]